MSSPRGHFTIYLTLPNYLNNLRRLGFTDDDFADGGSDRLVDGIVAWGDEAAIARRVQEHFDAGADHVCIQVVTPRGMQELPRRAVARARAGAGQLSGFSINTRSKRGSDPRPISS